MNVTYRQLDDDVALDGFRERRGKVLFFHGVQRRHGAAADGFARLFLVPGMNHCASGPATDQFDGLAALVDWVEQGLAPQAITARRTQALPGVSRPLCACPTVVRYQGGEPKEAGSFACR